MSDCSECCDSGLNCVSLSLGSEAKFKLDVKQQNISKRYSNKRFIKLIKIKALIKIPVYIETNVCLKKQHSYLNAIHKHWLLRRDI